MRPWTTRGGRSSKKLVRFSELLWKNLHSKELLNIKEKRGIDLLLKRTFIYRDKKNEKYFLNNFYSDYANLPIISSGYGIFWASTCQLYLIMAIGYEGKHRLSRLEIDRLWKSFDLPLYRGGGKLHVYKKGSGWFDAWSRVDLDSVAKKTCPKLYYWPQPFSVNQICCEGSIKRSISHDLVSKHSFMFL